MFIGSALSVMATQSSFTSVGVVPDPGDVWPGFVAPVFGYSSRQVTAGTPASSRSRRYNALVVTM
jgi:hypothetical protein